MNVFLDDERPTPKGWVRAWWPGEVIELLKTHKVNIISLDHDLGNDSIGTGYDVVLWIEKEVALGKLTPPIIKVHSANVPAKKKMLPGIKNIYKISAKKSQSIHE